MVMMVGSFSCVSCAVPFFSGPLEVLVHGGDTPGSRIEGPPKYLLRCVNEFATIATVTSYPPPPLCPLDAAF